MQAQNEIVWYDGLVNSRGYYTGEVKQLYKIIWLYGLDSNEVIGYPTWRQEKIGSETQSEWHDAMRKEVRTNIYFRKWDWYRQRVTAKIFIGVESEEVLWIQAVLFVSKY